MGAVLIFLYAVFRNTIRTKEEIATELNNKSLGTVPRIVFRKRGKQTDTTLLITNPKIPAGFSEAVRVFRNVVINSLKDDEKVVMVTSTAPSEGKTTVITNLALSVAKRNKKVLLVDGDLRNSSVAPLLDVNMDELDYQIISDKYEIAFVPQYNISLLRFIFNDDKKDGYLSTAFARSVFDDLRDKFDYIFVDTPPCGLVSDAMFIAQAADAAIYVVYQDAVRIGKIKSSLNNLLSTDIKVLGCVLNGTIGGTSGYGYGYGYKNYGYGYGYKGYGYGYKKYGYGYGDTKEKDEVE